MTNQEVFDKVWNHILTQGVPSVDEEVGKCLYRGPNGLKCAAGIFLTDEQAEEGDNVIFSSWVEVANRNNIKHLPNGLIASLQSCHDTAACNTHSYSSCDRSRVFLAVFKEMAKRVTEVYNLTIPAEGV